MQLPTKETACLIYLAAPYTRVPDVNAMMREVMRFSGELMSKHPGQHIVSPLFNHFSLDLVPGLGKDYAFWGAYSRNLLVRCDRMIVLCFPGWQQSTGVADEIALALSKQIPITYIPMEAA